MHKNFHYEYIKFKQILLQCKNDLQIITLIW